MTLSSPPLLSCVWEGEPPSLDRGPQAAVRGGLDLMPTAHAASCGSLVVTVFEPTNCHYWGPQANVWPDLCCPHPATPLCSGAAEGLPGAFLPGPPETLILARPVSTGGLAAGSLMKDIGCQHPSASGSQGVPWQAGQPLGQSFPLSAAS